MPEVPPRFSRTGCKITEQLGQGGAKLGGSEAGEWAGITEVGAVEARQEVLQTGTRLPVFLSLKLLYCFSLHY